MKNRIENVDHYNASLPGFKNWSAWKWVFNPQNACVFSMHKLEVATQLNEQPLLAMKIVQRNILFPAKSSRWTLSFHLTEPY